MSGDVCNSRLVMLELQDNGILRDGTGFICGRVMMEPPGHELQSCPHPDTERLDWLEQNRYHVLGLPGNTLREAIDAAREERDGL